jgi:hypothetical protein
MQHTMLVIKLKRAIGADLVPVNTVSVGRGNLLLGGAVRCCFGGASKYGQANGDFSREQTVLRSLLAWSEVVGVSSTKHVPQTWEGFQFQASVTRLPNVSPQFTPQSTRKITATNIPYPTGRGNISCRDIAPYLSMLQYVATICTSKARCRGLCQNP